MRSMLIIVLTIVTISNSIKNYGPFNISVHKFEFCKGPKNKDCCITSLRISSRTEIEYNITLVENLSSVKGKVITKSDDKKDPGLRLQINKPCDNLFLKPLFKTLFSMTDKCIMLKGTYRFHLDFNEVLQRYYGGMHLYGRQIFKSVFYNNDCNFICSYLEIDITPRN